MESPPSDADPCAICLDDITRGQAIFTAACSHTFHFRCISDSVASGHRFCPLCKATWRASTGSERRLAGTTTTTRWRRASSMRRPAVLKVHCERPAVARGDSPDGFAVLVHARAPDEGPRAPLDLVTVLDVVGSDDDSDKLELLIQAMGFVIDNLGPADRLSVLSFSFSNKATRVTRLTRMTDDGKAAAKRALEFELESSGGTNIADGLWMATQVLADRRHRNAVTSVILLSDEEDTYAMPSQRGDNVYAAAWFRSSGTRPAPVPIHTFGFGADHDVETMHTIAEATRGTFSFIKDPEVIQDAFAQCIGGLLSVAMQNARIHVICVHPGVRIRQVKCGRYESRIDADGRAAMVDVGELYAQEERRVLVFVDVPTAGAAEEATQLIKVRCTYRDTVTGQVVDVAGDDAVVQRPVEAPDGDAELSMEVERELVRVAATEDMAAAALTRRRLRYSTAGGRP
ncbi:hypothetical protein ACP70R_025913 [Stipagrostis hirtigluma subsp. patula]